MAAIWIIVAVVVVALVVVAAVALRTRRRPPAEQPSAGTPGAGTLTRPPGAPPDTLREPAPAPAAAAPAAEPVAPPGFRERLGRARGLFSPVRAVRGRGSVDAETWEQIEDALLRADVGVGTADALLADLRSRVGAREVQGTDGLLDALRSDLVRLLSVPGEATYVAEGDLGSVVAAHEGAPAHDGAAAATAGAGAGDGAVRSGRQLHFDQAADVTNVWLFVGVNGVGKTTTVGKVARQEAAQGRSVLLAAGDTFRAAAGEQLAQWAERSGAEIVRGAEGGDPSAIVFDAVQRASARGNDLVLADTAGRLHTKVNLVEELKKIRRVADRPPGVVSEVLLVLDATTGQNGLVQARQFTEAVDVTGVVLTKLDGTAKGGVVIAIQRELGIPVKLVGLGEGPDDLVAFDPQAFVDALLDA